MRRLFALMILICILFFPISPSGLESPTGRKLSPYLPLRAGEPYGLEAIFPSTCLAQEQLAGVTILGGRVGIGGDTYSDILFWWRCEGWTMGAGDHSHGDTTADHYSGAVINTDAVKLGTNGFSIPTTYDSAEFAISSSDIISSSIGRAGFWIYFTQWAASTQIFNAIHSGGRLRLYTSGTSELTFDYGATYKTVTSTTAALTTGVWYYIELIWNASNETQKIYVNSVEKASNTEAKDAPTGSSLLRLGNDLGATGYFYMDNIVVSNDPTRNLYLLKDTDSFPGS